MNKKISPKSNKKAIRTTKTTKATENEVENVVESVVESVVENIEENTNDSALTNSNQLEISQESNQHVSTVSKALMDHIWEIKNIVFVCCAIWLFFTIFCGFFLNQIQATLFQPAIKASLDLYFTSPMEALTFSIKLAAIGGFVLALPFITMVFWHYVQNALKTKEKNAVFIFTLTSSVLTVAAVAYSWLALVPTSLEILKGFTPNGTKIMLTMAEYFNFIFALTLALVVIFQIPTVVYSLIKTRIVTHKQVSNKRKEIYMAILIATALFGSPDLFSWLLTTIPAIALFEVSMILAVFSIKQEKNTNS